MLDDVFGEPNPEQRKGLRTISNQNLELLNMITSVLQATKVEADAVFAVPAEVDLGAALDKVKASFAILPPGKEALMGYMEISRRSADRANRRRKAPDHT
jgi:signal transduction histidine kinase